MRPKILGKGSRFVAYTRVSTEDQEEQGVSLDLQRTQLEAYARAHGELAGLLTDSLSGKSLERPGLRRALGMLVAGEADALLIAKLDRLTRNIVDGEWLRAEYFAGRFRLVSLSDPLDHLETADGAFLFRLLILLGQREREKTAERTKEGLAHKRATGGGTPRLEGAAVVRITELDAGGASLGQIARTLTDEGFQTMRWGRWAAETVRKVIARTAPHICK